MKTINIKGKEYTPVSERVLGFRIEHPEGSIITELLSAPSDPFVWIKATVRVAGGGILATGHSQANWDDKFSMVNKTSALENAETSAVGRALGLAGFGIIEQIASADELRKAQNSEHLSNEPAPQPLRKGATLSEATRAPGTDKKAPFEARLKRALGSPNFTPGEITMFWQKMKRAATLQECEDIAHDAEIKADPPAEQGKLV